MLRALIAALASLSASQAYACENPPMVTIPDGTTATEAALLQAQEAVRTYLVAMQDYLVCVQEEQTATGDNAPAEYKALMVKRQHAAMEEMEAVATLFNEQLKAYRSAHPMSAEPPAAMPGYALPDQNPATSPLGSSLETATAPPTTLP